MAKTKKVFKEKRHPIFCVKCETEMAPMNRYTASNGKLCAWYICPRRKKNGEHGCGHITSIDLKSFSTSKGMKLIPDSRLRGENLVQKLTKAKEEAERAKAELEGSYHELQQSKDHLVQSEKLAFAGRMAASVAHEIRNPLNMLVMSVQLLQNQLSKDHSSRELVDVIMRNLTRIDRLVAELVNCARPPRLKIGNHNVDTVINSVIATIKEKCNSQKVKIVKDFDSKIPKIRIDKEHIEQAILNMAKNALEAMPKGGAITFSADSDGEMAIISISDTGRGIPDKDIIRVFDPFFTTRKEGTGLGLAVCYAIIASHNGFINLESNKRGTCFTIQLPV